MKIVIGCDKGGLRLKQPVMDALREEGHEIIEVGTMSLEQIVPHSQTAHAAAEVIQRGEAEMGILICGTGMGMSICANKHKGIYAAVVESVYAAEYSRKINNANVLCMGAFMIGETMAKDMALAFVHTEFLQNFPEWRVKFLSGQLQYVQELEDEQFAK